MSINSHFMQRILSYISLLISISFYLFIFPINVCKWILLLLINRIYSKMAKYDLSIIIKMILFTKVIKVVSSNSFTCGWNTWKHLLWRSFGPRLEIQKYAMVPHKGFHQIIKNMLQKNWRMIVKNNNKILRIANFTF